MYDEALEVAPASASAQTPAAAASRPAKNGPAVESLGVILRRDMGLLRGMVSELSPPELDPQNLTSSLTDLSAALQEAGASFHIVVDDHLGLDDTTATLVYRVARESMHNAAKQAQPSSDEVRLKRENAHTVLTVVDDRQGFESTAEPGPGHFGPKLIRETVTQAGGTLLVDSVIGQGTRVELSLPHH
jgi:signal transduction histidine kinase